MASLISRDIRLDSALLHSAKAKTMITLSEIIQGDHAIDEATRAELLAAIATRGKNKGLVRASCPAGDKIGTVGWRALMSVLAPTRVGMLALMLMNEDERELFHKCDKFAEFYRFAINACGQHQLQFNMWAMRFDPDTAMTTIEPKVREAMATR